MRRFRRRPMLRAIVFPIAASLSLFGDGSSCAGAGPKAIRTRDAIRKLRNLEPQIKGYRWEFRFKRLQADRKSRKLTDPRKMEFAESAKHFGSTRAVYDAVHRRYRVEIQQVYPFEKSATGAIGAREAHAYDGEVFQHWQLQLHSLTIPPLPKPGGTATIEGSIKKGRKPGNWSLPHPCGLGFLPPYRLSVDDDIQVSIAELMQRRLNAGEKVPVTQMADGQWTIDVRNKDARGRVRIQVDPKRGGLVTKVERLNGKPPAVYQRRFVTKVRKLKGGIWVPVEIYTVNTIDGAAMRYEFPAIEVVSKFDDADFSLTFPAGTRFLR